ncbi:MAG: hypothetical protein SFZ02_12355 [bacterium]|nr:hypothetical protein [bacterium]
MEVNKLNERVALYEMIERAEAKQRADKKRKEAEQRATQARVYNRFQYFPQQSPIVAGFFDGDIYITDVLNEARPIINVGGKFVVGNAGDTPCEFESVQKAIIGARLALTTLFLGE